MKILLVNPSITKSEVYAKYSAGAPCLPPLGLCYLAAVLLQNGYVTKIIDCVAEDISTEKLKEEIKEYDPNIVGVTSTTVSYNAAKSLLQEIKELDPDIVTVFGGAHISALPDETMMECESLDIGVFGEGEYTILEIVERLNGEQSLEDINGTIIRNNGRIIMNEPRMAPEDMDDIPFPSRHLLKDLKAYSHTPFRGAKFVTTMITSRGCPFKCAYCDQSVFGRVWRHHSAEYVLSEIAHLKAKYNIDFISFEDDNFLLSKKRTAEICKGMIEKDFHISWSCLGRANEVDEKVLPLMKKAGCKTIYIGIESGSPRILELINKKIRIDEYRKGIELIKKFGINVTGSFILGVPTETEEDIDKTIKLALSLPLDGISFFTFTPYPNTPLRNLASKHGKVSNDWKDYSGHPSALPFIPDGMDEKYLLDVQADAYRRFLFRPSYLIKHINTFTNRKSLINGLKFIGSLVLK